MSTSVTGLRHDKFMSLRDTQIPHRVVRVGMPAILPATDIKSTIT